MPRRVTSGISALLLLFLRHRIVSSNNHVQQAANLTVHHRVFGGTDDANSPLRQQPCLVWDVQEVQNLQPKPPRTSPPLPSRPVTMWKIVMSTMIMIWKVAIQIMVTIREASMLLHAGDASGLACLVFESIKGAYDMIQPDKQQPVSLLALPAYRTHTRWPGSNDCVVCLPHTRCDHLFHVLCFCHLYFCDEHHRHIRISTSTPYLTSGSSTQWASYPRRRPSGSSPYRIFANTFGRHCSSRLANGGKGSRPADICPSPHSVAPPNLGCPVQHPLTIISFMNVTPLPTPPVGMKASAFQGHRRTCVR